MLTYVLTDSDMPLFGHLLSDSLITSSQGVYTCVPIHTKCPLTVHSSCGLDSVTPSLSWQEGLAYVLGKVLPSNSGVSLPPLGEETTLNHEPPSRSVTVICQA